MKQLYRSIQTTTNRIVMLTIHTYTGFIITGEQKSAALHQQFEIIDIKINFENKINLNKLRIYLK